MGQSANQTRQLAEAFAQDRENNLREFSNFFEEEIELPSRGLVYKSGSSVIKIRPMRGIEEDILTNERLVRTGKAFDMVLNNCITDGNGIERSELLFGDLNMLYVAIRSISYGSDYNIEITCPECGRKSPVTTSLREFEIKPLSTEPMQIGINKFSGTSSDGFKFVFKLLTNEDNKQLQEMEKMRRAKKLPNPEVAITDFLTKLILSIKNKSGIEFSSKLDIEKIVKEYLPLSVKREFTNYINSIRPDIDMSYQFECSHCGAVSKIAVPITPEFFWPAGGSGSEGVIA